MTIIVKLTAKQHCVIRADSSPDVPVNELVTIPENHYGTFYIRLCHGKNGVVVPESPFPAGWSGVPNITLVNNSGNDLYLRAGDEIGELHVRYNQPSPLSGSLMDLPSIFAFGSKDGQLRVVTSDGKLYQCEAIQYHVDENNIRRIDEVNDDWSIVEISLFSPVYQMLNYNFISICDCKTACDLITAYEKDKLNKCLTKVSSIFKENQDMHENLYKQATELDTIPRTTEGDVTEEYPDIINHLHGQNIKPEKHQVTETQTTSYEEIKSFILPDSFNVKKVDDSLAASICQIPIFKFTNYSLVYGEELKGFVYDVEDFESISKSSVKEIVEVSRKQLNKVYFVANQPTLINFEEDITLPRLEATQSLGLYAALILANFDKIAKRNLENASCILYRIFIFKAVIRIINKNLDSFANGKIWIKLLHRCIQGDRQAYKTYFDPAKDFPYKDKLISELKKADQSFHKPVELLDYLSHNSPWPFVTVIFGNEKTQLADPA